MVSAMLSLGSKISANLGGGKTHTQANQDQYKTYTSPITAREFEGRVEWIFDIEDENKQMRGDNILDDKLPEANFEFWDPSDDEPKSFAVKVSSYWSPASGKSRLSGIWLSNVCQIGEIEIPYNLSKVTRGYVKKYTWKEPNGISIPNGIERNTTGDARVMFTPGISSYEP
ncbi:hypothetical protein BDQ17DRAFT_1363336 [Cyathus striatus]|nr:hypothetical protein BDQ17DRAFT_1363336 [Cyathus striatus]